MCDHGKMMHKLRKLGVTGKLARWIQSFLTQRMQRVVVEGRTSSPYLVTSGVPEGTVLGPLLFLIYLSDLGENISAMKKVYVDDTKVKKPIKEEADVQVLQDDLEKLYDWAKENGMKFNGNKFQVMRYGPNESLKEDTMYFTEEMNEVIEQFETLRDLGVIVSDDATFDAHIDHVVKKVRQKTGWVLRTFYKRNPMFMKTMWKTIVLPHIDYCSQLWCPIKPGNILKIEKLQRDFFNRIPALRDLNYWEQLKQMKMLSIQRRLERYRILYMWRVLEGVTPNCGIEVKADDGRQGRRCKVPSIATKARTSVKALRDQTFQVNGPQLFNVIPIYLRKMTKCPIEDFKMALDQYLERLPDEPSMRGLTPGACTAEARPSNSILDQGRRPPGLGGRTCGSVC